MVAAASLVPMACSSDPSIESSDGSSSTPPADADGLGDVGDDDSASSPDGDPEPTDEAASAAPTSSPNGDPEPTDEASTSAPIAAGGDAAAVWSYVELDPSYYLYQRDVGDVTGDGRPDVVGVQEGDTTVELSQRLTGSAAP